MPDSHVSPEVLAMGDQLMAEAQSTLIDPMMAAARDFLKEFDSMLVIAMSARHLMEAGGYDAQPALIIAMLIVRHAQALDELDILRPKIN